MTPPSSWKSVPEPSLPSWRKIFDSTPSDHDLDVECPICGGRTLHRYYQLGRPIHHVDDQTTFVAHGVCWEWCSTCRSYEHYSALVPDWWSSELRIDESQLTALPDALEQTLEQASGDGEGSNTA